MNIKDKITLDIKEAMKAKDSAKLSALRMLKSAIDYKEMEIKGKDRDKEILDSDVIKVLQNLAKQRKESIDAYQKAGRQESAKKEQDELKIIETYLPKAVSEEEIEKIVKETVSELGASGPKDMGKVMKAVMEKLKERVVDGKTVSDKVKFILTQ